MTVENPRCCTGVRGPPPAADATDDASAGDAAAAADGRGARSEPTVADAAATTDACSASTEGAVAAEDSGAFWLLAAAVVDVEDSLNGGDGVAGARNDGTIGDS